MSASRRLTNIYHAVLDTMRGRRNAYRAVFSEPQGQIVLRSLTEFCEGDKTPFRESSHDMARMVGRQEVLNYIRDLTGDRFDERRLESLARDEAHRIERAITTSREGQDDEN